MNSRQIARRLFESLYLDEAARGMFSGFSRFRSRWRREFGNMDRRAISRYFQDAEVRKLQVGCGNHPLPGWLNADLEPLSPGIVQLDATKRFPFADGTFDYAFSEHMIEHIPHAGGRHMLAECHRVLRKGGRIRISTPDLRFLLDLYRDVPNPLQRRYLEWFSREHLGAKEPAAPVFVVNSFVRSWGHQFIYDEPALRESLRAAGFVEITRHELRQSDAEPLRGLENVERMPSGFLALETFTLEATR